MRRSICYTEPSSAMAGERNTWLFVYTTSTPMPKGTKLKFDLQTKGRDIDWEIPTSNLKKTNNVIYAHLDNGKILQAKEIEVPDCFTPQYEFVLPSEVPAGGNFSIVIGSPDSDEASVYKNGNKAQHNTQRRRSFLLYIDPSGKGNYQDPEVFSLDIRGNLLKSIRVLSPSFITRNKRFDVIVRFEDEFGNLTNNAPDDTLVELSHEHLRENLNWKLFVPETGFISLPNLYINEPGDYTIRLLNTATKEVFLSSPLRCFNENSKHLFWGLLHGESDRIDSTESIESCLRHFRDEKALNFYSTSSFEQQEETPNEIWKLIVQNTSDFDEADRFTTILGFQWQGTSPAEGVRQIIYCKDQKQILRRKDPKYSTLKKIYKSFNPKELISIPTFTAAKGFEYDFKDFDPDYERVVEIYNAWGSSECTAKEGNSRPIAFDGKKGISESSMGTIQNALLKNHRFGFVAGGLDDRGLYAELFEGDQIQYSPGLTAIITNEHTRSAIMDALYNRSCYATTGERIIVGLFIAGSPMGSELTTVSKHGLLVNRHISGYVSGTANLKSIEIIRNGKVIHTIKPEGYSCNFVYDDMQPLENVCIDAKDKKPPFVYYYVRATQNDGHLAWSSPIWVDYVPGSATGKSKIKALPPKSKKVLVVEDEEEDDDDFSFSYDDDDENEE